MTRYLRLLVLLAFQLALALPAPSGLPDYDYGSYDYDYDYGQSGQNLPFTIFDNAAPVKAPVQTGVFQPTPCTWAVINCCSNPDALGGRIACFERMGCTGAWFEDICTPEIKKGVSKVLLDSIRG